MFIRKAQLEDAMAIEEVHSRAYKISYRGYLPDDFLDNLSIDEEALKKTQNFLKTSEGYVVENQGKVIAFAFVGAFQQKCFEINALYVDPDFQRSGAGSLLVNYLLENKKQVGYKSCVVWTMSEGPSVGFYEKLLFVKTQNKKMWKFGISVIELVKSL